MKISIDTMVYYPLPAGSDAKPQRANKEYQLRQSEKDRLFEVVTRLERVFLFYEETIEVLMFRVFYEVGTEALWGHITLVSHLAKQKVVVSHEFDLRDQHLQPVVVAICFLNRFASACRGAHDTYLLGGQELNAAAMVLTRMSDELRSKLG